MNFDVAQQQLKTWIEKRVLAFARNAEKNFWQLKYKGGSIRRTGFSSGDE
jgi:hypothetical protein